MTALRHFRPCRGGVSRRLAALQAPELAQNDSEERLVQRVQRRDGVQLFLHQCMISLREIPSSRQKCSPHPRSAAQACISSTVFSTSCQIPKRDRDIWTDVARDPRAHSLRHNMCRLFKKGGPKKHTHLHVLHHCLQSFHDPQKTGHAQAARTSIHHGAAEDSVVNTRCAKVLLVSAFICLGEGIHDPQPSQGQMTVLRV